MFSGKIIYTRRVCWFEGGKDRLGVSVTRSTVDWTEAFLLQIKKQYPDNEHIVVWDGAGFHPKDSFHEQVPPDVHIVLLPPYSPELNPIEKLWDLIQDHTANKLWPTIERLDQVVAFHLKDWWEDLGRVIRLFGNGWIRASANAT